jgi:hypothetical protein
MTPAMLYPTPQSLVISANFEQTSPSCSRKPAGNHTERQRYLLTPKKVDQPGKLVPGHTHIIRPEENDPLPTQERFGSSSMQTAAQSELNVGRNFQPERR